MVFFISFIIGMLFPVVLIKVNLHFIKWIPAFVLFLSMIIMGLKAKFFPGVEMAVLGEIVYTMILGTAALGSFLSAIIIGVWKKSN